MTEAAREQKTESRAERIGNAVFGAFFVGIAGWIVVLAGSSTREQFVALVIGTLGADALSSAITGRRSLASRIGPLP